MVARLIDNPVSPVEDLSLPGRVCRPMIPRDIRSIVPWFADPDQAVRDHMDYPFDELEKRDWHGVLKSYYFAEGATSCVATVDRKVIGAGRVIPGRLVSYLPPIKMNLYILVGLSLNKIKDIVELENQW